MTADRAALRRDLRERRRTLSAAERIAGAQRLAAHLLSLPFAPQSGYVAGYWALDGEIGLHAWQVQLPSDCIYCLPVLGDDGALRFAPWRAGDPLASNRYGIPEPDVAATSLLEPRDLTLAVTPLVGFDPRGHRLGMGGGWYDRSFAFRQREPAPPWLVGAAFEVQRVDALDRADWDVALDAVCSDVAVYDCRHSLIA
ncbi:5-formyltetrahydrofolate cyclo-ligase [Lysobacter sp. 5GHs7-4]|uniref:5-formyltetrahydrofolate cyclo-ligase n=1 Tax=Lysobacter sp. 5GHs7-4 TaxID=2904253 RepID=UPI001E4CE94C|nr:5-formyltetrahydrofolate cyclo-ligase [Lysobacter sp. 5GHs7-4]UHQ24139.1 5-formyltetrahydrofolate cyclo-ligase [Lysobacter sp. 5GHs7-4]